MLINTCENIHSINATLLPSNDAESQLPLTRDVGMFPSALRPNTFRAGHGLTDIQTGREIAGFFFGINYFVFYSFKKQT